MTKLYDLVVGIKGAGEMASAVAWGLYKARIRSIFMMEIEEPLAVRRGVSFCEAVYDSHHTVEGIEAALARGLHGLPLIWRSGKIAVIVDPHWHAVEQFKPDVVIDAVLAKHNLGTVITEAPLVIALGPGFTAGEDAHLVVETNRGHNLGRIISSGTAEPDTGIPGSIGGHSEARVLRAPVDGVFVPQRFIGDLLKAGDVVGNVERQVIKTQIEGVLRGLIRGQRRVNKGLKIGDMDPTGEVTHCYTISDKARTLAGSALEAIMRVYNT